MTSIQPKKVMRHRGVVSLILLLVLAVGGLLLDSVFGNQFLAVHSIPTPVLAPMLIAPSALLIASTPLRAQVRSRYPTAWVRWLFWPAFILCLAGLLFISGHGWVAGASRLLARKQSTVELQVVTVGRYESRRKLCLQWVEVKYMEVKSQLCADPFLARGEVLAGKKLLAVGVASPLGLHIEALRLR
jgi:hypothetical protein